MTRTMIERQIALASQRLSNATSQAEAATAQSDLDSLKAMLAEME